MIALQEKAPAKEVRVKFSARQSMALRALQDPGTDELMYGGAKGGGKSVFLNWWCYMEAARICREHNIAPRKHPIPVGWMGRLRGKHFKDTTLQTWFKQIPGELYTLRASEQEIIIADRVKIDYGGLDDQNAVNKFNSAEYGFIALDQAEEVSKDKIAVLRASVGRLCINGMAVPAKALYTANPAPCWLKDDFILNPTARRRFIQALPADNPFLPGPYIEVLKEAFRHRPDLLAAYLEGSWDAYESADQVILNLWVQAALKTIIPAGGLKKFLVCDPARFGDDETVIYLFYNSALRAQKIFGKKDTVYTASFLHIWALQEKVSAVVIDDIGVGGGVTDQLRALAGNSYQVIALNSSEKALHHPEKYYNLRAEMWDTAAQALQRGDVDWTSLAGWMSPADLNLLLGQLCTPKYDFRAGRVLIEAKEDIKARLGRSPDRGDTAVMGLYILPRIPESKAGGQGIGARGAGKQKKRSAMAA
jgi:phage terminase large subunit